MSDFISPIINDILSEEQEELIEGMTEEEYMDFAERNSAP